MTYFFKLGDIEYKAKTKVVVGRGSPFDKVDYGQSFERGHFKLNKRKENFLIYDNGSKASVLVNGKQVPQKKWCRVREEDEIFIGKIPLKLMNKTESTDYVEVINFTSHVAKLSKFNFFQKLLVLFAFAFVLCSLSQFGSIDSSLIISFVFSFFVTLFWSFLAKYFGTNDELFINDVTIGTSGLTLYYRDNNMSARFDEIKHCYKHYNSIVVYIKDESFVFHQMVNMDGLYKTLIDRVPTSARETKPQGQQDKKKFYIFTSLSISLSTAYIFSTYTNWGRAELAVSCAIILFLLNAWIFKAKISGTLENSKTVEHNKKSRKYLTLCALYMIYGQYSSYQDLELAQKNIVSCLKNNLKSCDQIDYLALENSISISDKEIKEIKRKVCQLDESYCETFSARSIASESP